MTKYGDDKEWEAHVDLLFGDWGSPDLTLTLRHIVQYARSGPFFPADMHVELIKRAYKEKEPSKDD